MGDGAIYESVPISAIPEVTREHWQSDPVPSVLVERPIRASLVTAAPRASHLVQQAYLSDVVLAELTDIPVEDKHDVPVASLIDDVKRKQDLRKVMGKGNKFGHEGDEDDDTVIDSGTPTLPKELVNYRYSGQKGRMCQDCRNFVEPAGCTLVIGMIRPVDTCDRFEPKTPEGVAAFGQPGLIQATLVNAEESDRHREREFFKRLQAKMEADGYDAGYAEVSPPGWEGTVLRMKKHPEVTNPWALAWYMKGQGYDSHAGPRGGKRKEAIRESELVTGEAGTPEGAKKGWEKRQRSGGESPKPRNARDINKSLAAAGYDERVQYLPKAGVWVMSGGDSHKWYSSTPFQGISRKSGLNITLKDWIAERNKMSTDKEAGTSAGVKKGWDTRKAGGRSKFAPAEHDDEDSTTAAFTRRENPRQRRARIKRKPVDPETAAAIRRALMSEGVRESVMVYRSTARLLETDYEVEAGTSDGAKKGWISRKGSGGGSSRADRIRRANQDQRRQDRRDEIQQQKDNDEHNKLIDKLDADYDKLHGFKRDRTGSYVGWDKKTRQPKFERRPKKSESYVPNMQSEGEAGTPEGAKKGWEKRKGGGPQQGKKLSHAQRGARARWDRDATQKRAMARYAKSAGVSVQTLRKHVFKANPMGYSGWVPVRDQVKKLKGRRKSESYVPIIVRAELIQA